MKWKQPGSVLTALMGTVVFLAVLWVLAHVTGIDARIAQRLSPPNTGLIFVESPEVYTRQRLVNDRYLQDAWLKDQLEVIDSEDSVFIDTQSWIETVLRARIEGDGETDKTGVTLAEDGGQGDLKIPFQVRFELQSAARDKIRQLILENALDDRHDLTGNTVFGLKFDTAVLPGSNSSLSPTVVVRMGEDIIRRLPPPADLAPYYLVERRAAFTPDDEVRGIPDAIAQLDSYFQGWQRSVEERLSVQAALRKRYLRSAQNLSATWGDPLDTPLCSLSSAYDSGFRVNPILGAQLYTAMYDGKPVNSALAFMMRIPDEVVDFGTRFVELLKTRLLAESARFCESEGEAVLDGVAFARDQATLGDWLTRKSGTGNYFPLPGFWGQLFDLNLSVHMSYFGDARSAETKIELYDKRVDLIYVAEGLTADLHDAALRAGWWPLLCPVKEDCTKGEGVLLGRYLNRLSTFGDGAAGPVLSEDMAKVLIDYFVQLDNIPQQCLVRFTPEAEWQFVGALNTATEAFLQESGGEKACFAGVSDLFKFGRTLFLDRISQVESYTYAAFPRGDVRGVVTDVTSVQDVGAAADGPGGFDLGLGFAARTRTNEAKARPSIINFASGAGTAQRSGAGLNDSGQSEETFDFGWSIVKDGPKEPMIASQLVLVSVPGYLQRLTLEVWTGFLDINRIPVDRCKALGGGATKSAGRTSPECADGGAGSYNSMILEERLRHAMTSFERRVFSLNIPPDFTALDGLIIGPDLISGPRINPYEMERCVSVDPTEFTLAIPGERLWRSTVVTLDGRRASQIEVLPDMRGILATFRPAGSRESVIPVVTSEEDANEHPPKLNLTVWTSEGHNSIEMEIRDARQGAAGICP